jgi:hypothetical protein
MGVNSRGGRTGASNGTNGEGSTSAIGHLSTLVFTPDVQNTRNELVEPGTFVHPTGRSKYPNDLTCRDSSAGVASPVNCESQFEFARDGSSNPIHEKDAVIESVSFFSF